MGGIGALSPSNAPGRGQGAKVTATQQRPKTPPTASLPPPRPPARQGDTRGESRATKGHPSLGCKGEKRSNSLSPRKGADLTRRASVSVRQEAARCIRWLGVILHASRDTVCNAVSCNRPRCRTQWIPHPGAVLMCAARPPCRGRPAAARSRPHEEGTKRQPQPSPTQRESYCGIPVGGILPPCPSPQDGPVTSPHSQGEDVRGGHSATGREGSPAKARPLPGGTDLPVCHPATAETPKPTAQGEQALQPQFPDYRERGG